MTRTSIVAVMDKRLFSIARRSLVTKCPMEVQVAQLPTKDGKVNHIHNEDGVGRVGYCTVLELCISVQLTQPTTEKTLE